VELTGRKAAIKAESREEAALPRKVCCAVGCTVLIESKARPRSPSPWPLTNVEETWVASSTACEVTVVPPTSTVSVPTVPLAPEP